MKKLLLSAAALCCFVSAQAQWLPAGATSGPIYYTGGKVGIGTTNPADNLEIYSTADADVKLRFTSTNPQRSFWIPFGHPYSYKTAIVSQSLNDWYRYNMHFCVNTSPNESSITIADSKLAISGFTGNVGIGVADPQARLHVYQPTSAGSNLNEYALISTISTSGGSGGNIVKQNTWVRRNAAGNSWLTLNWHDGLSVDGSFLVPGMSSSNWQGASKTWWERDPASGRQSWGNANVTHLAIESSGDVVVGTPTPAGVPGIYKLNVWGRARANELVVNTDGADFVFEDNYRLRPLGEVEQFITTNKHLPEIPSAREMQQNGMAVGELQTKLLQKVEELTLYVIEQNKQLQELKKDNESLKKSIEEKKQSNN